MSANRRRVAAWAAAVGLVALGAGWAQAATIGRGDVVVLSMVSDNANGAFGTSDGFSWAPLVDLDEGDVLLFTDSSWNIQVAGDFNGLESLIQYTVPAGGLASGTISLVDLQDLPAGYAAVGSAETGSVDPMQLSTFGDQIAVFTGTVSAPAFVFAVNTDQTDWTGSSGSASSSRSDLYSGLTDGVDAVAVGAGPSPGAEFDNAYYSGPTGRTDRATWLARVADQGNWTGQDDGAAVTAANVSAGLGAGGVLPIGCPPPAKSFLSVSRVRRRARVYRGVPMVSSYAFGFLDVGPGGTDFTSAATVTLGADVIDMPAGLTAVGPGAWEFSNATTRVRLDQRGSASRYGMRVDVRRVSALTDTGPVGVSFDNADGLSAEATITMDGGRFRAGRGAAAGPPFALEYFRAVVSGMGGDRFYFRGRIPYDGSAVGAAPDLLVCAGDFVQEIDATAVTAAGTRYRFYDRDVARGLATGVRRILVDAGRGIVKVDATRVDLGTFMGPDAPLTVGFGIDGDDHAVEVLASAPDPSVLRY